MWEISHRADIRARLIADRHYNRQKVGSPQFVPPGRCLVLYTKTETGEAFWVTSWPFAEYVKHAWRAVKDSSILIKEAVLLTCQKWEPPPLGMITFINTKKVRPIKRRGEDHWGYCYEKAGFELVGQTKAGLLAFQLTPEKMSYVQI